nr:MAG TPA: hypothetical protein [Caudoviricetes sp.]
MYLQNNFQHYISYISSNFLFNINIKLKRDRLK